MEENKRGNQEILREILEGTFEKLYQYSKEQYQALEDRVMEELRGDACRYDLYMGLAKRQQYDLSDSFLVPMEDRDIRGETLGDMEEIRGCLQRGVRYPVKKVYFQCDYLKLHRILERQKHWKGLIRTGQGSYEAMFEIERDRSYEEKLKALYPVFLENGIPWKPVNAPYIHKMVTIWLTGCGHDFKKDKEIQDILPDLGEYADLIKEDRIPLWNVKRVTAKTMGFARPVDGRKRYEHKISLREEGSSHGYLIEKKMDAEWETRRSRDYLHTVAATDESLVWPLIKIVDQSEKRREYEGIASNAPEPSFLEAYSGRPVFPIRTGAEIQRVFYSCPNMKNMELLHYNITGEEGRGETYDIQEYLRDTLRRKEQRGRMVFTIHEKKPSYLSRDYMSYFVALMQDYFPEYRCEGILL